MALVQNSILRGAEVGDYDWVSELLYSPQFDGVREVITKERVNNPLVLAAKSGNLKLVRLMIEQFGFDKESVGTVLFSQDEDHILEAPALWTAATAGNLPIVKYLVSIGCCVNRPTKTGSTPIRGACYDGYLEVVKYLVMHDGNFNTPNENKQSPLLVASGMNHIKLVKYLISLGADLNTQAVKGLTALHIACERDYVDVALLLMEAGAKLLRDDQGASALMLSAINGHERTVSALLKRIPDQLIPTETMADLLTVLGCSLYDRVLQGHWNATQVGAFMCWHKAANLRESLPTQVLSRLAASRVVLPEVYGDEATEPLTRSQLERVLPDESRVNVFTLVARERILGPSHYLIYFLRLRTAIELDRRHYEYSLVLLDRSIHLSYAALPSDMNPLRYLDQATFILQCHGKASRDKQCRITTVFFEWMTVQIEVFHSNFLNQLTTEKLKHGDDENLIKLWLHELVLLLNLNGQECTEGVDQLIKRVARLGYRTKERGSSVLHIACSLDTATFDISSQLMGPLWPNLTCLKLLCGYFDVDARDNSGCTPLHTSIQNTTDTTLRYSTAEVLLESGAHPDSLSLIGESPADCETALSFNKDCSVKNLLQKYTPLKCQAARVLGRHLLKYKERVPPSLLYFISLHTSYMTYDTCLESQQ